MDSARKLFLAVGYEATSIADILENSGVNSGSLYYFYRTKEDLLLAVLDWYLTNLYPQVIDPACAKSDDAMERVFAVLDGYRQLLRLTQCRIGCPIGNLALELSEKSERVRAKIAENFGSWRKAISAMLAALQEKLPPGAEPDAIGVFILTVMEGGVMQARAHRDVSYFDISVAVLRDYLNRLIEPGAGPVSSKVGADPPPVAADAQRWKDVVPRKEIDL